MAQDPVNSMQKRPLLLVLLLLLGLSAYMLPWAVSSSAPMTLNAYDLAEWTSLHPAQRHSSPPLLAPLLLRAQLVILTLILALPTSGRHWRAISALAVVALSVAQLPPFEYVYDIANLNYRQQFLLALVSLITGLAATRMANWRIIRMLLVLLPVAGLVSVIAGVTQALEVYQLTQSVASIGLGPWLLSSSYVGIAAANLLAARSDAVQVMN